jgi:hypothetical protein
VVDSCDVCDGMDGDVDCFDVCFGDGFTDIAGDCCESSEADACGLCFGPATNPEDCIPLVTVSISDLSENADDTFTATINMQNTIPVAGWQFDLTSIPAGVTLLEVYGGSSEDAGHSISFSPSGTVIGFSLTGNAIPFSNELLVEIFLSIDSEYAILDLEGGVFSDLAGGSIPVEYGNSWLYGDLPDIPLAPTNLTATLFESTNISLDWDDSELADFYTIYRDGMMLTTSDSSDYLDTNLEELTTSLIHLKY